MNPLEILRRQIEVELNKHDDKRLTELLLECSSMLELFEQLLRKLPKNGKIRNTNT